MDYLQHAKLISFQKISTFWPFILGGPIPYYPRERRKGSSRGRKWEKGNHPKVDETQGFQYLGHSKWTICSLLNWFCSKHLQLFALHTGRSNCLLPQKEAERKQQGQKMGKRELPESWWDTGFSVLGAFKMEPLASVNLILFQKISNSIHTGISNSVLPQREEERKQQGQKMGERESSKSGWDTGVSVLEEFKLDHLQPVKTDFVPKMSNFLPFIMGGPIPYYPRERKKGSSRGRKWETGTHPKVDETQGFL